MQETFLQKFGKLEERSESLPSKKLDSNQQEIQTMNLAS